jgi:SAM-dependent methyltransferase
MPDFSVRDPATPEFWSERFEQQFTPWDKGGVPQDLQRFVAQSPSRTVLIPGCGSGHEVAFLSDAGWDVTAIDFSPAAVAAARAHLGKWADRVLQADFFEVAPATTLDVIYERAFLCALPRQMWPGIARRWAELLPPGGLLAGFFFLGAAPKGPPFGIDAAELQQLLEPAFEKLEDEPVADSIPVFEGRERWQVWRRRQSAADVKSFSQQS